MFLFGQQNTKDICRRCCFIHKFVNHCRSIDSLFIATQTKYVQIPNRELELKTHLLLMLENFNLTIE